MDQYDNTNSGAVFSTDDATLLEGPFNGPNMESQRAVVELNLETGEHTLRIHERGKKGGPVGKPILQGIVTRQTSKDPRAPKARGVLVNAKGEPAQDVVLWGIHANKDDPTSTLVGLQIKQDNPKASMKPISI